MGTLEVGELLYEYTVKLTGMREFGVSFQALMDGTALPPPEGARFDVPFEGESSGPKIKGNVSEVDYLPIRADGRFELHIHPRLLSLIRGLTRECKLWKTRRTTYGRKRLVGTL